MPPEPPCPTAATSARSPEYSPTSEGCLRVSGPRLNTRLDNPYLLGSLAVFVLFFLTRRMLLSSFIGVLVFFAAQWFCAGV
ncbi:MAG: AzlD domain-containing protein [Pseudomonas sp.]